ncbi:hypothetical protein CWC28_09880 [Pseudoalteromonas sp. S4492]|uniref:CC0125/CC1285 family lipoprotein n=1 Tax=Pseudoalteromonas sp. S4492 TaxID=579560 RepID=UPI00110BE766|nr:hypothetical protein [Pseudoalteromonas sp. S4492]TMO28038.1 hypothetical protein CWC28_09880 [Pseudoalteromonas sp. S4492]
MKHVLLAYFAIVLIGCTSSQHSTDKSIPGLTTKQLADNQYILRYETRHGSKRSALEQSMLQAANITIDTGYDWFLVAEQAVDVERSKPTNKPRFEQRAHCGLLTCTSQTSPALHVSTLLERTIVTRLTIILGKGIKPSEKAHDAYTLIEGGDNTQN